MSNRTAEFDTTAGTFRVELFEDRAPGTTKNFIDLVEKGYYNGLVFLTEVDFRLPCSVLIDWISTRRPLGAAT